jgi:vitamin B12 transporter
VNVGRVAANGAELEARAARGPLAMRASFTLLQTNVDEAGAADDPLYQQGSRLIRRPQHTASLALTYDAAFSISTVVSYTGERDDLDFASFPATRVELPAYVKIDATMRSPSFAGARGVLRVENVLDVQYQEVLGFPARGRVIFLGLSL